MVDSYTGLMTKIEHGSAKTVVVGLGYVGLPLAVLHAQAGFSVTGIERNTSRVQQVNEGKSYIEEVPDTDLRFLIKNGLLVATQDFACISEADVVAICVPTPLSSNKQPDTSYIKQVLEWARPFLHAGQLIVLESTTYPGTTEEILVSVLVDSGLEIGRDAFVAYSPERIDPGNKKFNVRDIPRVVGGVTDRCAEVACRFYDKILSSRSYAVSTPKVAEMTKLFENVFRVVNVSLVNELALMCDHMGIDVWEVIDAANTKPFGFMPFYPGPGIGGHCIPIDPYFLSWKAKEFGFTPRFIELAGDFNDQMPNHIAEEVSNILNNYGKPINGSRILIIGVAFKKDVGDIRESAAIKIAGILEARGAMISYHDSHVPEVVINGCNYDSEQLNTKLLQESDLTVITTDHSNVDYQMIARSGTPVYDTRGTLRAFSGDHIYRFGAPRLPS